MQRDKSIGIDTSKAKLDVYETSTAKQDEFSNNGKGIRKLIRYLQKIGADFVTIECTGKYHRKASRMISEAGFPILIAQPKRVKDFARGLGYLAKTDPIDARCIALYGQKSDLEPTKIISVEMELLKDLVARAHQLSCSIADEKNRLSTAAKSLETSSERMIKHLKKEREKIRSLISKQIDKCQEVSERFKLLCSAKGVGEVVAATLVAYLPELGELNKREVAALCGVAPYNHDSGKLKGKRSIYGGRTIVRSALYMAALSAARFDPFLSQVYQRLKANGKNARVALTAIMRKLVIQLNSMVRDGVAWNPDIPLKNI